MSTVQVKTVVMDERSQDWDQLKARGYCRQPVTGIGEPCPPADIPRSVILLGDARQQLERLPSDSIDCAVTSPPYYMLRDYGAKEQIGLEASVEEWVGHLRLVFEELRRVLKPAGSLWLNLGDSFSRHSRYGAPPKSLTCAPERLLLALAADGWIVRNKVVWSKPNPLPSSVADRLNLTYEVIYLLVHSPQYFFDLDAIREPHRSHTARRAGTPVDKKPDWAGPLAGKQDGLRRARPADQPGHELGKNPGDVWTIPTKGFRGPHFATFPPDLLRRPILATCPEAICTRCGTPWKRRVTARRIPVGPVSKAPKPTDPQVMRFNDRWHVVREIGDLMPCACLAPTVSGLVIDPFMGAGTVGLVAEQLGRDWLGIEISPHYRKLALKRIEDARSQP